MVESTPAPTNVRRPPLTTRVTRERPWSKWHARAAAGWYGTQDRTLEGTCAEALRHPRIASVRAPRMPGPRRRFRVAFLSGYCPGSRSDSALLVPFALSEVLDSSRASVVDLGGVEAFPGF